MFWWQRPLVFSESSFSQFLKASEAKAALFFLEVVSDLWKSILWIGQETFEQSGLNNFRIDRIYPIQLHIFVSTHLNWNPWSRFSKPTWVTLLCTSSTELRSFAKRNFNKLQCSCRASHTPCKWPSPVRSVCLSVFFSVPWSWLCTPRRPLP